MQILDQYGRPFDESQLGTPQTGMMASIPATWGDSPVDGLTPAKLLRILKAARTGDIAQQSALFTEMEERDPAMAGEIIKRKNAITAREMQIEPPDSPASNESKCAAFFEEYIKYLDLSDHLLDAGEGIGHGFMAFEFEGWGDIDGVRVPTGLIARPQTWFRLRQQDGTIGTAWRMNRTDLRLLDGSAFGAELQPFGWWVHVHRSLAGGLHRAGLFRVLCWLYLYKHFALRDFAEFLEIYGIPMRVGKFDPNNITPRDKSVMYQALQSMGHDAAGIIPNTMQIELLAAASGQTDGHERLYRIANEEYAKAITGKDPQHQGGMGGGNGKQEENNEQVRQDINVGDCRQVANSFTNDVLWPIAALRFGITELRRCPRLTFNTQRGTDREALGKSFMSMLDVGIPIPKKWAREQAQIPEATEGDELLVKPSAPAPIIEPNNPPAGAKTANPGQAAAKPPVPSEVGKPVDQGAATLTALLQANLALSTVANATPATLNRDDLDDATDVLLDGWQPVMDDLLAPVRAILSDAAKNGASLEAVQARLHTAMNKMDTAALADLLANGQFAALLAGRAGLIKPDA